MIDVRLPDRKTLKTLWEKIGNVRGLSALPLQMGPNTSLIQNISLIVCPLTTVPQKVVDRPVTVHKFMNSNCTAAQSLHQDMVQVIQQLVATGKLLQNSLHVQTGKNNKRKITKEGKGTGNELLIYWCWIH